MNSSELHTLYNAFTPAGGYWSTFLIWAKDRFTLGRSDYQRQFEAIYTALQLVRRLKKLEQKYAKELFCVSGIVWLKAKDNRRPGLVWVPEPTPNETALTGKPEFEDT